MIRSRHALTTSLVLAATTATAVADTTINFFGDIDYKVENEDGTENTFQASTFDIFASQTEGKFTFIGEVVVEAFGSNDFVVDADRLEVVYKAKPWLKLVVGRIRTAFGYYSDAYQNGKFFMVPVSWPEMYEGEGFDGIVPSHSVGLHADVARELGNEDGCITLDAEVLNGRGLDSGEVSAFRDANDSKAVNLRLRYVGEDALDGLIVGGNLYLDDIPADATPGIEHDAMHELIVGGHVAYNADDIHAVAEGTWFRHREHGTHQEHTTFAGLAELGYTFGDYTPYARAELFHFSDADPYFATSGLETEDHQEYSFGVKYIASASVSLKAQAGIDADADVTGYLAIAQAAFAF